MNQSPIRVICATKKTLNQFKHTNTGNSLISMCVVTNTELKLFSENTFGLSEMYNIAIEEAIDSPAILAFIHDDVLVTDFFWGDRIRNSLKSFDIVGVVGNQRRIEKQPGWILKDLEGNIDSNENLSGCIGQGDFFPPKKLDYFGPSNLECKLLDGVFLAAPSEVFHTHGLRFDPQFKFHFYDMDFCRSAESLGLKMGTCDISLVHQSYGQLNQDWRQSYDLYLKKWGQ